MISDNVLISLITTGGGLLTLYIAWRLKNKKPNRERVDGVLDIYERIIKDLNAENIRLKAENAKLLAKSVDDFEEQEYSK